MTADFQKNTRYTIGLISDTHGRLPSAALSALNNCELVIHAGDIDSPEILDRLKETAPTVAVRGNMDQGAWSLSLPESRIVRVGEVVLLVCHILDKRKPEDGAVTVVVYGHTHRPDAYMENGVLFVNPGSASAPRYHHPPSVARLHVNGKHIRVEHVALDEDRQD
ncbi:MAG: metallophosphoesterase family protein [Thermodesulfobacteriota bacterium]